MATSESSSSSTSSAEIRSLSEAEQAKLDQLFQATSSVNTEIYRPTPNSANANELQNLSNLYVRPESNPRLQNFLPSTPVGMSQQHFSNMEYLTARYLKQQQQQQQFQQLQQQRQLLLQQEARRSVYRNGSFDSQLNFLRKELVSLMLSFSFDLYFEVTNSISVVFKVKLSFRRIKSTKIPIFQVGLRQLDMDLLCQLWSLNEMLVDVKKTMEDRRKESQIVDEEDEEG
jgi:hypothetical protein